MAAVSDAPALAPLSPDPPGDRESTADSERIRRLMARFIGGGYVAYFAVTAPEVLSQAGYVALWWTPVALITTYLPGWLLIPAGYFSDLRTIARLAALCGAGYAISVGLWFVAWSGVHVPGDRATFLVLFPGLASLALVLTRWPLLSIGHLAIAASTVMVANDRGRSQHFESAIAPEIVWAIAFSGVFVGAAIMAVRTGDLLDRSRAYAYTLAAQAAAEQARGIERERYDWLVHDRVLAIMRAARRSGVDERLSAKARQALAEFETETEAPDRPTSLSVSELFALLRTAAAVVDDTVPVTTRNSCTGPAPELPAAAGHALGEATGEALRNSRNHAGREATIGVLVDIGESSVAVTIADNGRGFDPALVPQQRIGIAVSIRRRMQRAGGAAEILSAPGAGTQVRLQWPK
ncbi:sensor histidine kinase [Nocardia fluminea]|uniref:sensor histidine kinase n=1 Tax=Nocardia fluminea TaxID=134984 RepID=UPI00366E7079